MQNGPGILQRQRFCWFDDPALLFVPDPYFYGPIVSSAGSGHDPIDDGIIRSGSSARKPNRCTCGRFRVAGFCDPGWNGPCAGTNRIRYQPCRPIVYIFQNRIRIFHKFIGHNSPPYETVTVKIPLAFQLMAIGPATSETGPPRSRKPIACLPAAVSL